MEDYQMEDLTTPLHMEDDQMEDLTNPELPPSEWPHRSPKRIRLDPTICSITSTFPDFNDMNIPNDNNETSLILIPDQRASISPSRSLQTKSARQRSISPRKILENRVLQKVFSDAKKMANLKRKRVPNIRDEDQLYMTVYALDSNEKALLKRIGKLRVQDLKLVKKLGGGGFANVYKILNERFCRHEKYAMKVVELNPTAQPFPSARDHIRNEINIMQLLKDDPHPGIVGMVESIEDNQLHLYGIITEYMNGGTLKDVLDKNEGVLSDRDISVIARKLLCGLIYLKNNHIAHLDLKPTNVLVSKDGDDVKVGDFGTSLIINESESVNTYNLSVGTSKYLSPERFYPSTFKISKACDIYKSDVWSLGISLLECCWCEETRSDRGMEFRCRIIMRKEVPSVPKERSEGLKEFVKDCLLIDVSERPHATKLIEHPFIKEFENCDKLDCTSTK